MAQHTTIGVTSHANFDPFNRRVDLWFKSSDGVQAPGLACEIQFRQYDRAMQQPPCIRLEMGEAQQLIDELWRAGLRPSEGTGSAGALEATQKHLADLRTIALPLIEDQRKLLMMLAHGPVRIIGGDDAGARSTVRMPGVDARG